MIADSAGRCALRKTCTDPCTSCASRLLFAAYERAEGRWYNSTHARLLWRKAQLALHEEAFYG